MGGRLEVRTIAVTPLPQPGRTRDNMPNPHTALFPSHSPPYHHSFRQVVKLEDTVPPALSTSSSSLSQLRTTTRSTNSKRPQLAPHGSPQARGCCTPTPLMASIHPSECEECAQSCQDGTCAVELTPQCTDQCIVVACNEDHHDPIACENCALAPPCEVMCTDSDECPGLEEIVSADKAHRAIVPGSLSGFPIASMLLGLPTDCGVHREAFSRHVQSPGPFRLAFYTIQYTCLA